MQMSSLFINPKLTGDIYSTSEVKTNKTWKNGKAIYRSYLTYNVQGSGTISKTHNLNIEEVVKIEALCTIAGQTPSSHGYRPMPQVNASLQYQFSINAITTNEISFLANGWDNNTAYLTLEYTKAN